MADISENYIKQIELVQKNESTGNNESTFINIGSPHLKRITYSELKILKDHGKLEEGTWYRITDYGDKDASLPSSIENVYPPFTFTFLKSYGQSFPYSSIIR